MRQIRLGVLDQDSEYLEPMKAYFRSGDAGKAFRLAAFTRLEALLDHSDESGKLDLLLVGPGYASELAKLRDAAAVCCDFGEEASGAGGSENKLPFVAKYQPLDQLAADLRELVSEHWFADARASRQSGRAIAVYSASGGCGKSMAAWNLAAGLAYYGSRTLLVSLEGFQSDTPFVSASGEDRYGKLLYYAKADPKGLPARLGALVQSDPKSGLFCIEPLLHSSDMESLSADETAALIDSLRSSGFDYIVLDLSSALDERAEAALRGSDAVLWLVTDDALCLSKTAKAYSEWSARLAGEPLRERILLGVNRCMGTPVHALELDGLAPAFCLPYMPEWKAVTSPGQLLAEPSIKDMLAAAVRNYFADREAVVLA